MLERSLWALALTAGVATVAQLLLGSKASLPTGNPLPAMRGVLMYDAAQLKEAADSVSSADPFRLDRRSPKSTLSDPASASPAVVGVPVLFHLALSGVSGGPPWHAIVSGIPGHDGGVMVDAGDTIGGIRIRAIRRDTVIVQTRDSTLTVTLKR